MALPPVMRAEAVCDTLYRALRDEPWEGAIHSVFDHAVNMETDRGLVSLLCAGRSLQPYSLRLAAQSSPSFLGWKAGMRAALSRGGLTLEGKEAVALQGARPVSLSIADAFADKTGYCRSFLRTGSLLAVLEQAGETNGLSSLATGSDLNVYAAVLAPRLPALYEAVDCNDAERAAEAAARIAGCGVGLTPSSDDLLTGYLSVLHALAAAQGRPGLIPLAGGIAEAAAKKTNRISGAFLQQSGRGLVSEDVLALLRILFSDADAEQAADAARRVAAFGSTSGTDTLTGIVLAIIHHNGGKNSG